MSRTDRIFLLVLLAVLSLLLVHGRSLGACTQDDSFISFRYAENLVAGHGLVFNPGWEPVEGYTNFLWTVLLAGFIALGFDPVPVSWILGVGCGVAILLLTRRFSARWCGRGGWESVPALIFFAASSAFAGEAVQGLETLFYTLLLLAGTYLLLAARDGDRRAGIGSAVLFGLAALTRPEGAMVAGLGFLYLLVAGWRDRAGRAEPRFPAVFAAAAWAAPVAALLGPYLLWRRWFYGFWVPNTFFVKTGGGLAQLERGLRYGHDFLLGVFPVLLLAAGFLVLLYRDRRRWVVFPLLLVVVYTLYVISIGGDFKSTFRFFMPIYPFLVLIAQEGIFAPAEPRRPVPIRLWIGLGLTALVIPIFREWVKLIGSGFDMRILFLPLLLLVLGLTLRGVLDRKRGSLPALAGVLLLGGFLAAWGENLGESFRYLIFLYPLLFLAGLEGLLRSVRQERPEWARAGLVLVLTAAIGAHLYGFSNGSRLFSYALRESLVTKKLIAGHLREITRQGDVLAIGTVGIVPYYSGLPTIDMWGLTDLHIAHQESPWSGRGDPGHEKGDGRYVFERRPAIIVFVSLARTRHPFPPEQLPELRPNLFLSEQQLLQIPAFLERYELRSDFLAGYYFNYFRIREEAGG